MTYGDEPLEKFIALTTNARKMQRSFLLASVLRTAIRRIIAKIPKQIALARRPQTTSQSSANIIPSVEQTASAMVQRPSDEDTKVVALKSRELKEAVRPHFKASIEDAQWAVSQSAPVVQLWIECQIAEHFGAGDWREVKTTLKDRTFRKAKTVLEKQGLFEFRRLTNVSPKGRVTATGWLVHNNHGYYNKQYWEVTSVCTDQRRSSTDQRRSSTDQRRSSTDRRRSVQTEVEPETLARKEVENAQPRLNYVSTTHQLPTKVVGGVVGIPKEKEETLLGSAPPTMHGMPEGEENNDSLALNLNPPPPPAIGGSEFMADSADLEVGHSLASLEDQTQAASEEPKDLGVGNFSAAPPLPASFPIQVGDVVSLDWPGSPFDGRVGTVRCVDVEASEADIRFDGLGSDATFPIARLFHADPPASPDQLPVGQLNDAASLTVSDNSNLVGEICAFALTHDCRIEDAEKEEMQMFNSNELENLLSDFQKQIAKWSYGSGATKRERFQFALRLVRSRRRSKDC